MPTLLKPLHGKPPVTQMYGENPAAYPATQGHNGLDWGVPIGSPVCAAQAGLVVRADLDPGGYGLHVRIQHADCLTIYGHLSEISIHRDEQVKPGRLIGLSGNTGRSTGPHLHFEVRLASSLLSCIDPLPCLVDDLHIEPVFRVKTVVENLNLRFGPGTSYPILRRLPAATELDVLEIADSTYWLRTPEGCVAGRHFGEDYVEILP
jgi:murein DD-endopeptidase MepM/ murein hydrolase activator NlpD